MTADDPPGLRGDSLKLHEGGTVSLQFDAAPGDLRLFRVQMARSLDPTLPWEVLTNSTVTERAAGVFEVVFSAPDASSPWFFRIAASQRVVGGLQITEVMSDNTAVLPDVGGEFWDWIEIYNPNDEAVDLEGYALTSDPLQPSEWVFPDVLVQPNSFLVVYASGLDRRVPGVALHTNFRISAAGERLLLTGPNQEVVQRLDIPPLGANESYGRSPEDEGIWVIYSPAQVTPGQSNSAISSGPPILPPLFPGGTQFLAAGAVMALTMQASTPGSTIRFTTNGSPVTTTSTIYSGPVALSRGAMVRAKVFLGDRSSAETIRTYFFGVSHDLPVVSLGAPASNFEFRDGYLFGMGSSVLSAGGQVLQNYPFSGSNAWRDREIEVAIEFFEVDGEARFRQRAGLAVFGGWGSRGYPQKSLALFARRAYGEGNFNHRIFPDRDIERFESLVLRNSGNDNQSTHQTAPRPPITEFGPTRSYGSYFVNGNFTLMRDALEQRLVSDIGLDTQAYRPAVVYLNGEYWGLYNLREKIAEPYILANHGFAKGEVDLIEGYGSVMAGDGTAYAAMRAFVATRDLRLAANYEVVATQYLEIDNFIDYHLAVIYFQNFDIGNIKCWRPRLGDGRFRWILYDQDYGFNLWPPEVYVPAMARDYADYDNMFTFHTASSGTGTGWPNEGGRTLLLRRLLMNESFRMRFIQRCADLLNTRFREDRVVPLIHGMAAVIRPEIPAHLQRWSWTELSKRGYGAPYQPEYAPFTIETWEANLAGMVDFALTRPTRLRRDCADHFGLRQGMAEVYAETIPAGSGRLRFNTATIESFPWSGVFFKDFPVELSAIPRPGYRFVSWSGAGVTTNAPQWQVQPSESTNTFVARFDSETSSPPDNPGVFVSEFQYHPGPQAESGDWIELFNPGATVMDTTGWIVRDSTDDNEWVLPESSIPPGGTLILCQDLLRYRRIYPNPTNSVGSFSFGLNNSGDSIRLYEPTGTLLVHLVYDDAFPWPPKADGTGHTLQLIDPYHFSTSAGAWQASPEAGGTPGRVSP